MSWSDPTFEAVADLLVRQTGLVFSPPRRPAVEAGVLRAMHRARVSDATRYLTLLAADAAVLDDLVVELTVGETYFFREPAQFAFLRGVVLPDLLPRVGAATGVRAWSAGCASGEEAYSLAIVFAESGARDRTHLLATDISRAALAKARRAVFGAWSLRGEGAAAARLYLRPAGDNRFQLDERIRRLVHFEYLNLALDHYPSLATETWGLHVIFCRNVLIYFNTETIRAVARRLYESLAPGGWLFTAASDPPLAPYARFETVTTEAGVLYRRDPLPVVAPLVAGADKGTRGPGDQGTRGIEAISPAGTEAVAEGKAVPPAPLVLLSPCPLVPLSAPTDPVAEARQALADGDYQRAADLTADRPDAVAGVLHVRALANLDADRAERACGEALAQNPLSAELCFLRGVLLIGLGRDADAAQALRRVLYLDRSLAVAHFTLAAVLERLGDGDGARRAYRNARDLSRARPAGEVAPLADGETAGRIADAATMQLAVLDAVVEDVS